MHRTTTSIFCTLHKLAQVYSSPTLQTSPVPFYFLFILPSSSSQQRLRRRHTRRRQFLLTLHEQSFSLIAAPFNATPRLGSPPDRFLVVSFFLSVTEITNGFLLLKKNPTIVHSLSLLLYQLLNQVMPNFSALLLCSSH